jgi:glycosyltransferase 2 family protein
VETDSAPRPPSRRHRWRTVVVLTVVAGFFALTLVSRWHQVTAVKWSLDLNFFALACLALALSYALVATLWALPMSKVTPLPLAAGARIWFVANLARYVPGNVWSFVGAVELARREGAPRRTTLAVMALTQALSVGVALLVGLPVVLAEWARLGRTALVGLVIMVGLALVVAALWRPLERLVRRRYPDLGTVIDRLLRRGGGEVAADAPMLPSAWTIVGLAGGYALYWGVTGLAFAALIRSIFPLPASGIPLAVAGYAASYAIGFLSLLTPAGLGVREAVLVLALAPVMPAGPALVVALVSRLWMMVFELLGAVAAYGIERVLHRPATRDTPERVRG